MLWKWIAIGTMTLGMLAGHSSARACGEKSAQAASREEAALLAEVQSAAGGVRPASSSVRFESVRMSQLGSPSLQRSLGMSSGGTSRYRLLSGPGAGGRSPASLGSGSADLMQLSWVDLRGVGRGEASFRASPVRLGVNPTSYRLKSFQQEVPWLE